MSVQTRRQSIPFASTVNYHLRHYHRSILTSSVVMTDDSNPALESVDTSPKLQFIDIGANLLDDRFVSGTYRGTIRHASDLSAVVERAVQVGVTGVILTSGTLDESRKAVAAVRSYRHLYPHIHWSCTVGVHPTRCQQEFVDRNPKGDDDEYEYGEYVLNELLSIAQDGMTDRSVVAIGEIGLDYDRLEFCPADIQQRFLEKQLHVLVRTTGLPLFLHNRAAQSDLPRLLQLHADCWQHKGGGVVHSFDDSLDLAHEFLSLGLYIGLNGCSLKTHDNLRTVKDLPLDRILLETDCPYCEVRPTHAGYSFVSTHFPARSEKKFEMGVPVKNRQEPCHIVQVAQVVAGMKGMDVSELARACYDNTRRLYGWNDNNADDN